MKQVFDIDIIYDDGTKETIPMVRGIVYNVIMNSDELLVQDIHTGISRIKKLHTNPIKITIKNIRKVTTKIVIDDKLTKEYAKEKQRLTVAGKHKDI